MVKKSLIWLYAFTTYLLWGIIIIVASVVLGMRYYVLPRVQDYRDDITRFASQTIGQNVTIGKLSAGWDGLNPYFDLRQITIYDQQQRPALQFDHIEASLSWLSLAVMEPRLDNLTIHEPRLTVRREADGSIYVAGMPLVGDETPSDFPNWLLRQEEIVVRNAAIIWQDDMRHSPQLALEKLNLVIERPVSRSLLNYHRFGLTAIPSVSASKPIDIRGSIYGGDVDVPDAWHGTLYAATEGTEISAWRTWLPIPETFHQGQGAVRVWVEFANSAITTASADMALGNVITQFNLAKPPLALNQVTGHLNLKQVGKEGFDLTATRLSLDAGQGLRISNGFAKLHKTNAQAPLDGELSVDQLALEPLVALADYMPIGDENRKKLAALSPAGSLKNLRLSWQAKEDALQKYAIKAGFSGLGISSLDAMPGFTGLSGQVDANEAKGTLALNSASATLNIPSVFRQPIPADNLQAEVNWKNQAGNTEVTVSRFTIASKHLKGVINATYRADGIKGGYIDLTGDIRDADAKYASFYYPNILGKETLDWLDTSILAGRSDDIKVRLKGYLDDFPYIGGKTGEFSVTATIRDGFIDYADEWPKIEGVKLKMKFYENKMLLTEGSGRSLGAQIMNTTVRINDLEAEHTQLEIEGQAQGTMQEALNFIEKSPIRESIDGFTDGMKGSGNGKVALKLQIPIDNLDATRVNGNYSTVNGGLTGDNIPPLERLIGRLDFTESSIKGDRIQAAIYGSPLVFSIATGTNDRLDIKARGRLTHSTIQQIAGNPLTSRLFGSAEWRGQIGIQGKQSDLVIEFPDLMGLSSSLPYPLDKPAATKMPLRIEQRQTTSGDSIAAVYGAADRALSLRMLRTLQNGKPVIDRADLRLGGEPHPKALAKGINISGSLAHLDADLWQDILDTPGNAKQDTDAMPAIQTARLKMGWMDVFDKRINDLQLDLKSDGVNWKSNIQSKEVNGDITWLPQGHGHIIAKLESLKVPESAPPKLSNPETESKAVEYPSISLTANQFEFSNKKLGKLELRAMQNGNQWDIESLRMDNPDFMLNASGSWQNWRSRANTRLNIALDVTDLGKAMERFGYPDTVKGSTATLQGNLAWPGSPQAFAADKLSGNFSLNVTKGQFLKIQPGGVGRLLGLLSLQSLPRRLILDFRDIFSSGFAFDKIAGDVKIAQGVMTSDNFVMEGPAAKVEISGQTDLAKETQNLRVKVTPSVSDSVSLAALAGGPAVAVGAFIAQKLLKDPFNQIASYEYNIVGTWDDPQEVEKDSKPAAPVPSPLGK